MLTDPAETGAVVLALPQDVQAEAFDFPARFFEPRVWRIERPPPDAARDRGGRRAARAAPSGRCSIAGGGVHYSEAWDALAEFAEAFGIPVGETFAGKGAVAEDAWFGARRRSGSRATRPRTRSRATPTS